MLGAAGQDGLDWVKARRSAGAGMCVELAAHPDGVAVRHSLAPREGAILYTSDEFRVFLEAAKNGEFDHLL